MPRVISSLKIFQNFEFQIFDDHEQLYLKDLLIVIHYEPSIINRYSMVSRVLQNLDYRPSTNTLETKIDTIATEITTLFPDNKKAEFLAEQVHLLLKKTKGRRYSNQLLAMACMWLHTSHALYSQILEDNVITMPNDKYVQR